MRAAYSCPAQDAPLAQAAHSSNPETRPEAVGGSRSPPVFARSRARAKTELALSGIDVILSGSSERSPPVLSAGVGTHRFHGRSIASS